MKRFILKTLLFLSPVILLELYVLLFYSTSESPDLLRLGYIPRTHPFYRSIFKEAFRQPVRFTRFTETKKKNFTVLITGDSFSEQDNYGYKNFLAAYPGMDVLQFDKPLSATPNPLQTLFNLTNGDFFEHYAVKYVILQSVERRIIARYDDTDSSSALTLDQISKINLPPAAASEQHGFFSDRIYMFPWYSLQYRSDSNILLNNVNTVRTSGQLFSVPEKKLLFFNEDVTSTSMNNNRTSVEGLNNLLNVLDQRLKKKNIRLIVLPCPDKYDLYYDYIVDKKDLPRPVFFNLFDTMPKQYLYLNAKQILQGKLNTQKDLYFYDDTHWSPFAAKLVAQSLAEMMKANPHL